MFYHHGMEEPENDHGARTSAGAYIIDLILRPQSMLVLDSIVCVLGLGSLVYAILRFTNVVGDQPFLEDCALTVDVFEGMADVFVFYGVALESRTHLIRKFSQDPQREKASDQLNGISEHTGILLVVLGLMLELASQFGMLAEDLKVIDWILAPFCILGFVLVTVTLQQVIVHLLSVVRALRADR